ncbi:MAG: DUF429 domain-containing protein [Candidatus Hydrogenedentes bacterium]|nr:DUF429 domain-containing protein [Candidatus Hydrogenedentota bacterium]
MTTVLALDAAWTDKQPTGVALLVGEGCHWRCAALAPSYQSFLGLANGVAVDWNGTFHGSAPDIPALLSAAAQIANTQSVDVVAIDMPVATCPIKGRRISDDAVSKRFGGRKCGTHTPNSVRPGPLGAKLTRDFGGHGFKVATAEVAPGTSGCLIEVYPHPALLRLLDVDERVPYKAGKAGRYWKGTTVPERTRLLLEQFDRILCALGQHIGDIPLRLPRHPEVRCLAHLKKYEDALDALVSGWVAMRYLNGQAEPFGDGTSAIWVPKKGKVC